MKIETYICLQRDEINLSIPYAVVCETVGSSLWGTRKQKELAKQWFTEDEINQIPNLYKQARTWYLIKGVPEELKLTTETLSLWYKLANFCSLL